MEPLGRIGGKEWRSDPGPDGTAGKPVLSLIACSRNDDYQGKAVWRLQTGLNLTARTIHALGLEASVEIILSDWGSETPLRHALCLTPEAARLVRVLEVPPELAARYQRDAPFSEVHALNAAARRARGEYIGRIDQDTILGREFFERFFRLYRGEDTLEDGVPLPHALMLSNRRGVPYRLVAGCPSPWVIDRFLRWFAPRLAPAMPLPEAEYYKSYVGIWLIHRDRWFEIGGYDESFIYINWMEVDMILRLEPESRFVNLGRLIGHRIYHLDHIHPLVHWGARGRVRRENPVRDRSRPPPVKCPNPEDWGLAREPLTLRPYPLKPGEAEAALGSVDRPRWGMFLGRVAWSGLRRAMDRVALGTIAVLAAGPRLLLALAPGLRARVLSYRDTLRGEPLARWGTRLREHRKARRADSNRPSPTGRLSGPARPEQRVNPREHRS